jgi:hypothetical protein
MIKHLDEETKEVAVCQTARVSWKHIVMGSDSGSIEKRQTWKLKRN